jgi:kynurenine 3-monooxygenase
MEKVSVIGGGLVGSLLSIFLAKHGFSIEVFERRADPRTGAAERGRSINLALSDRGWKALNLADPSLAEEVKKNAIPMKGRMIHDERGIQTLQPYGKEGQYIYSISRAILNQVLIEFGEKHHQVQYRFNERCIDIDLNTDQLHFENTITYQAHQHIPDYVFGTDGAFSAVRYALQKTERFDFSQKYLEYGYKELAIPAGQQNRHLLDKNALHIWPRKSFMLIALPNTDGSFTCTLFLPFEGTNSFEHLNDARSIENFFEKNFSDVLNLIPDLIDQFTSNPTSSLVTVQCYPWVYKNKYVLLGDAAHAIVPFYGQGMNAGFEDCTILDNILNEFPGDFANALQKFKKERKPNTDAIAELALRNFVEMRDLVIDDRFILRKKIEAKLHKLFPTDWIPLYTMVTFSEMDYAEALRLGKIQDRIMDEVLDISGIETSWENIDFEAVITKYKTAEKSPSGIL